MTKAGAAEPDEGAQTPRRAARLHAAAGKSVDRIRLKLKFVSCYASLGTLLWPSYFASSGMQGDAARPRATPITTRRYWTIFAPVRQNRDPMVHFAGAPVVFAFRGTKFAEARSSAARSERLIPSQTSAVHN